MRKWVETMGLVDSILSEQRGDLNKADSRLLKDMSVNPDLDVYLFAGSNHLRNRVAENDGMGSVRVLQQRHDRFSNCEQKPISSQLPVPRFPPSFHSRFGSAPSRKGRNQWF